MCLSFECLLEFPWQLGEREALSLSTRARATETALAPAETLGESHSALAAGWNTSRALSIRCCQVAEFRSCWAATRETRGKAWPWNTARARAWGFLERKKSSEGEMGLAMPHPPFQSRTGTGLTERRGPHPGLTRTGPARSATACPEAKFTHSHK